ncbi:MAG: ABC transporter substrate-binding protein [Candidatus Acidiferrales bacterium]
MKLQSSRFRAIASGLVVALALPIGGAERPRYGGALHVEIGASVAALDPGVVSENPDEAGAKDDLLPLVFETLVTLDANGAPQPGLATSWNADAAQKTWSFALRRGVKFHDGSLVTSGAVAAALEAANPDWKVQTGGGIGGVLYEMIQISTSSTAPDLPEQLAEIRYAIWKRTADGSVVGTGPFKITTWEARKRAVFAENQDYWAGRPFLDSVDVQMGQPAKNRAIDLQLGKADLVDLPPDLARRASDDKLRVSTTSPAELLALVFPPGHKATDDARVREAVAKSIDRAAIVTFILQKQGEPAASLLPQWLSGSAFLFAASADPVAAHALWTQIHAAPALVLGYDSNEPLEQAVAERIAVNAKEAGIPLSARAIPANSNAAPIAARIVRARFDSPEPRLALADLLANFAPILGEDATPLPASATSEELYARERAALDTYRVVPLVHLPRIYGLGTRVRNWQILPGQSLEGWRLADVWLEEEAP